MASAAAESATPGVEMSASQVRLTSPFELRSPFDKSMRESRLFQNLGRELPLCVLLIVVPIAGCDNTKGDPKQVTQVAAKVNSDEITVHRVNYVLGRTESSTTENAENAKREVLEKLIDQEIARQQAIKSELDRSPDVVQAIEAAKAEILARAFLEQLAANVPEPAVWEVQKYYQDHTELFAQRRIFDIEELMFTLGEDLAELRKALPEAGSMPQIISLLQSNGVKYATNRAARSAEQIPLAILPKVHAMKPGDIGLFDRGGKEFHVLRLVAFKLEPVDEATATARIQRFLHNQRTGEYIAGALKALRDQATIEYAGEFARRESGTSGANITVNPTPQSESGQTAEQHKSDVNTGTSVQ